MNLAKPPALMAGGVSQGDLVTPTDGAQMIWVNLIMDAFAALALATKPLHLGAHDWLPRDPAGFIVTGPTACLVFGVGGLFLTLLVALILGLRGIGELPAGNEASRGASVQRIRPPTTNSSPLWPTTAD